MLDFPRVEAYKLRFLDRDHAELPLGVGVHAVGRIDPVDGRDSGARAIDLVEDAPLLRICVDRRGVWMTVEPTVGGVHVNGRPVQRLAMLRPGDAVFADGVEMTLVAARGVETVPRHMLSAPVEDGGDPRVLLRGVGGRYHGRSFTLEQPRLIGRAGEADIRVDDPAFDERHARIEVNGDAIVLRDLGSADGSMVNGDIVRDALLQPGDQIVFDPHHRFVVEAPARHRVQHQQASGQLESDEYALEQGQPLAYEGWRQSTRRLPSLLLTALLLALGLGALLLFGAH